MNYYYRVFVIVSVCLACVLVTNLKLNFNHVPQKVVNNPPNTEISARLTHSDNVKILKGEKSANICKECGRSIPNVIVQYGPERSASTLQYYILCLMMLTLHEDDVKSVSCLYERRSSKKYRVIKSHTFRYLKTFPPNVWIFMTSSPAKRKTILQEKDKLEQSNYYIPSIVDTTEISRRGVFIAYDYQPIFGISDKQMANILEYLRFWDILRLCCGKEMSSDWRNKLSPRKRYKPHHDLHDIAYPACEMYNISQVELLFMNTNIFKTFTQFASVRKVIGRPSELDRTLDGHYCERCNRYIAKHHLSYKENCI